MEKQLRLVNGLYEMVDVPDQEEEMDWVVVHHPVFASKQLHSQAEIQDHLAKGWSLTPVIQNEKSILQARIAEYESDLFQIKANLAALEGKEHKGEEVHPIVKSMILANKNLTIENGRLRDILNERDEQVRALNTENHEFCATIEELSKKISVMKQEMESGKAVEVKPERKKPGRKKKVVKKGA